MKINQIVSEHKKGVRARGYTKKGPEPRKVTKQDTQGVPTAFAGQVAKEDAAQQVYKVTKSDPNTGLTLSKPDGTQLILPPDKMNAIAANPNDPNKYLLNPDAIAQQATNGQPSGPEIGREVEVNTAEEGNPEQAFGEEMDDAGDVGGDPTDAYIDSVVDHDFERAQGRLRELAGMPPATGEVPATPEPAPIVDRTTGPAIDTVDGFKSALVNAATDGGGDAEKLAPLVDQLVVAAPDGTVDAKGSLINIMSKAADAGADVTNMMEQMLAGFTKAMNSPEFINGTDDATKESVRASLEEIKEIVARMKGHVQTMQAQQPALRALRNDPNAKFESKELDAMLRIAGLR